MKQTEKVKHYLNGAWYYQKKADFLEEKIRVLRARAQKMTTSFQDVPTFGGFADHRQQVIAEMVDTEREYRKMTQQCRNKKQEIEYLISLVGDHQEALVLEMRYLYYENWQTIALKLNYDVRSIYRIHGKALLSLIAIHKRIIEASGKRLF